MFAAQAFEVGRVGRAQRVGHRVVVDKVATVDYLGGSLTRWTTRRHSSSKTALFRI
jgi:hypothetical protein